MAQKQKTSFLSLSAELRNRIYEETLRGRTTRRNQPETTRLAEPSLLRVCWQVRREALAMYLREVQVVVVSGITPQPPGNADVVAALVPLLIDLERAGFNLRATRCYQHLAVQVAAELGRGGEWRFVRRP